jgi:hypothetical protein
MTTRLDKPIKREITAGAETLVLTLTPTSVTITPKGRRKGKTFTWADLWSGEAALAEQLRASVAAMGPLSGAAAFNPSQALAPKKPGKR